MNKNQWQKRWRECRSAYGHYQANGWAPKELMPFMPLVEFVKSQPCKPSRSHGLPF